MNIFLRLLITLIWSSLVCDPAPAQELRIKLAHSAAPNSVMALCAEQFASAVKKSQIDVQLYGAGSLVPFNQLLASVASAQIEMALMPLTSANASPEFGIFELPFLIQDRGHVRRIRSELVSKFLAPAAQTKGVRILAMWEDGFRDITTSSKPIKSPGDLKGLKLRVLPTPWMQTAFSNLGATLVMTSFAEVPGALQRGIIDGQESPLAAIEFLKLYEVQKYLSLTRHTYTPAFLIVSRSFFERLSQPQQATLTEQAAGIQDHCLDLGSDKEISVVENLKTKMDINFVNLQPFRAASEDIYANFAKSTPSGRSLIELVKLSTYGTGGGGDPCPLGQCRCSNNTCSKDCCK